MVSRGSLLLLLVLSAPAGAQDLSPGEPGWTDLAQEGEYRTYRKEGAGSALGLLLVGVLDAPPDRVFALVTDFARFPQVMPFVKYSQIIHTEGNGSYRTTYAFFYISPPFIADRYYTLKLVGERDADGRKGAFRSRWVQHRGPHCRTPEHPDVAGRFETGVSDPVETIQNEGQWDLTPLEGGKRTLARYRVAVDVGGAVPSWMVKQANSVGLPDLWRALKTALAK